MLGLWADKRIPNKRLSRSGLRYIPPSLDSWGDEQVLGAAVLHQFAHEHEDALVARAPRLRHVVRDDDDGVAALQREHQLLDCARAFHVERAARFVHQNDFGLERQQARDAELLLLLELERGGFVVEPVLQVIPKADFGQRLLDGFVEIATFFKPARRCECAGRTRRSRKPKSAADWAAEKPCRRDLRSSISETSGS